MVEGIFCKEDKFAGKCRAKSKSQQDTRVKEILSIKILHKNWN